METSGDDVANGGCFQELRQFQENLSYHQINVFGGFNYDSVMFSGISLSTKKICLPYDRDNQHYNVITNVKSGAAKQNLCNRCDTLYDETHKYDNVCSLSFATPPCTKDQT